MDSTLSGRMSNERFSATSKDVVKSETTLMVLFTAEMYANMLSIIHGVVYAMSLDVYYIRHIYYSHYTM